MLPHIYLGHVLNNYEAPRPHTRSHLALASIPKSERIALDAR